MRNSIARRLLILTLMLGASFVALSFVLQAFDGWKMRAIVRDLGAERAERFESTFSLVGHTPEAMCLDYSMWDETVKFVASPDLAWAAENIDSVLDRFRVTAVQAYDAEGRFVYGVDRRGRRGGQPVPFDAETLGALLGRRATATFFEATPQGVYLVFAGRVTRTDDEARKEWHGSLMSLVLMDAGFLKDLERLTGATIRLVSSKSGARARAGEREPGTTTFYKALADHGGHTIGYLCVEQGIPGYELVGKASAQSKWTVSLFSLALFLVLSWFLHRWVVVPLTSVSSALRQNDVSKIDRIIDHKSEFGAVARLIVQFFEQKATLLEEVLMRQQAENELAAARDHALALATSKSQFLANMSHEIRTPMNGVIGISELLASTELDARQREYVETMRSSSDTLLTVINDVLEFSKLEAGRVQLESEPFDVLDVAERVCTLFAPQAAAKGIDLVVNPGLGLAPSYLGDATRLSQVFSNLIGNAMKFTERGFVMVAVEELPNGDGSPWVQVSVRDTGIGIARDRQEAVFTNFAQADLGTTRRYGGTGLGLAICKLIVECMGGEIGLESEPNLGSTFWFRVPLKVAEASAQPPLDKTGLAGKLALIVDPGEVSRVALARQLAAWDVRVETAVTAEDAWARLTDNRRSIDFLLIDEHIEGVDPAQLASWVEAQAACGQKVGIIHVGGISADGSPGPVAKPIRRVTLHRALLGSSGAATQWPATEPNLAAGAGAYGLRILLAEDNAVNSMVAVRMLEKLGCSVDVACNGLEAVAMAQERDYDVVFMDVHMPEMGGYEATGALRELERGTWRRRTIVAMTADAMEGDREACLAAGMDDYVSKPITLAALGRILEDWGDMSRAA